ncbi:hypothetical protein ACRRTK_019186 [Alexandromys fortis]
MASPLGLWAVKSELLYPRFPRQLPEINRDPGLLSGQVTLDITITLISWSSKCLQVSKWPEKTSVLLLQEQKTGGSHPRKSRLREQVNKSRRLEAHTLEGQDSGSR